MTVYKSETIDTILNINKKIKNTIFIHFEGSEINDSYNDIIRVEDADGEESFYIAGKVADDNFCNIDDIAEICDMFTVIPSGDNIENFDESDFEAFAVPYNQVA